MTIETMPVADLITDTRMSKWQKTKQQTIQEKHALIDLTNHSLCTLLTLTTFTPQSQIVTLLHNSRALKTHSSYIDTNKQPLYMDKSNSISSSISSSSISISSSNSGSSNDDNDNGDDGDPSTVTNFRHLTLYRKMGKFFFVGQSRTPTLRYRWLRGGRGPLQDITTKDWTIEPVGLDSRTNYSCYAYNEGGKGVMSTINLEVHAPPFFIKNLPPYTGIFHTAHRVNLTCRIECVPRCDITWLKDGYAIESNNSRYFVKDKYMDASPATGDFESILSVLVSCYYRERTRSVHLVDFSFIKFTAF